VRYIKIERDINGDRSRKRQKMKEKRQRETESGGNSRER
jgi:hypothetical protein